MLITLAALAAAIAALTLQYVQTVRYLEAEERAQVAAEAASLVRRYEATGLSGLAAFLDRQEQGRGLHDFFYLLATADGRPIAGNLLTWPDTVREPGPYGFAVEVISSQGMQRRWAEVRALRIGPGYRLLVGQVADTRFALRERYVESLTWTMLVTLLIGLVLGWWLSRRALRFIEIAADTGERLLAGDLGQRLPVSPRQDEYDRLAEIINACFSDLERTVESLRTATDALAHDLKTPLTRIKARLAVARMRRADASGLRQAIEETDGDLDALLRSINDVLALARIEGTSAETFERVDLASVVADALELYRPACEEKGIELSSELTPAWMQGVRSLLGRAVANLLDNAVRHTPEDGRIQVTVAARGDRIDLTIADTGPGIAAPSRERALKRFVRLDPSRTEPGTGLGLSLVASIVRVHRGTLELADNHPGLRVKLGFEAA